VDDVKRALGSTMFFKDLSRLDPSKKGLQVGEVLRVYEEKGAYTLAFLKGTDERTRKQYKDKLDTGRVQYKVGPDFSL
jgi:hypothetical protein